MDWVFFSTQAWDEMGGAGRPTHYLARELLARGHRVLFAEFQPSAATAPAPDNLTRLNFAELGFDEHAHRRAWFGLDPRVSNEFESKFLRALEQFESPATWGGERAWHVAVWADPFVPFVRLFPLLRAHNYTLVYEALDDFEALPELGLYFANTAAERFLVKHADLTIAVSSTLAEKLSTWEHRGAIQLLRQGVTPRAAVPARNVPPPPNLVRGDTTLGFWGHVSHFNIDVELLEYVARRHPEWAINLIGPVDHDPAQPAIGPTLRRLPNVHLLGRVAHHELADYLPWFDVALIPYPDNAFNRARDPLKVYEYLQGHKPVVAAHAPQLRDMPYVYLAATPAEFLQQIEYALNVRVDPTVIDAYLAGCTWSKRLDHLLQWIGESEPSREAITLDPTEWYRSAPVPPNVRAYVAQVEQLLQERTAYIARMEQEGKATQDYIRRLEATHPGKWLKRVSASLIK